MLTRRSLFERILGGTAAAAIAPHVTLEAAPAPLGPPAPTFDQILGDAIGRRMLEAYTEVVLHTSAGEVVLPWSDTVTYAPTRAVTVHRVTMRVPVASGPPVEVPVSVQYGPYGMYEGSVSLTAGDVLSLSLGVGDEVIDAIARGWRQGS